MAPHHGIFTDRIEPLLVTEAQHRDHAIVEQVIADLKAGPLAHCPSVIWSRPATVHDVHDVA